MKILFMGTPDYALASLRALVSSGDEIVGVLTQPDKPKGRGYTLLPPPIKVYALEAGLDVYQPTTLRDEAFAELLEKLDPELIVVVAYGKILPEAILNIPKYGCVNGHASLLPRHRGASPIQWSIVCGDKVTGITTMLMEKGLDTGDMLLKEELVIGENETGEELHDRLSLIGADLMIKTLIGLEEGSIIPEKQDDSLSTYAPIINREMGHIDFTKSAAEIHNLIRGFYSWPAAYFFLHGKRVKVLSSRLSFSTDKPAGTVVKSDTELVISCGDGNCVLLCEIQPEGSKRMSAADYLKGHSIEKGTVISSEQ